MDTVQRLLVVFLFSFSSVSFADTYPTVYDYGYYNGAQVYGFTSYQAACSAYATLKSYVSGTSDSSGVCSLYYPAGTVSSTTSLYKRGTCPGGGSLSGSSCINAPACDIGQTRDAATGICTIPPPDCTAGQTKSLTEFSPAGNLSLTIGGGPTLTDGGCEYKCTEDISRESANSAGYYTKHSSCTTTGKTADQSTGKAASATDALGQATDYEPAANGCAKGPDKNGVIREVCVSASGEGTFNGVPVKMDGINMLDKDGNVINAGSGKNCISGNGKFVCASTLADATQTITITHPDGTTQTINVNSKVQTNTTDSKVANPDGSTTETATTTNNVEGDGNRTTTTVTDANGNKTITSTGPTDSLELEQINEGVHKSECDKNPGSVACLKIDGTVPAAEVLPVDNVSLSLNPVSMGSAGSCPAPVSTSIKGRSISLSFEPICQIASMISPLVIALAWLVAGYMVVGVVKE